MAKGISSKLKWRKKKWFTVYASQAFNEVELGETPGIDSKDIIGRTVEANAFTLLNDPKKQNKKITFKIIKVVGGKALTKVSGYALSLSYLKRLIRKNGSRVDVIFKAVTKDNKEILIKMIAFSSSRIQKSVKKALRAKLIELGKKEISTYDYDIFVSAVINSKFQKDIKKKLDKITPLKFVEVLKFSS